MNKLHIIKALSNETRWQILEWLKKPEQSFPNMKSPYVPRLGICNGAIQRKAGLSQSTISHYLALLERCDLLIATREGQWTYYKRNEETIRAFGEMMHQSL